MEAIEGGAWHTYGDILLYGCAAASLIFVLLYMTLAPWWRHEAGRNIMAVMGSLAIGIMYFAWVVGRGGVPAGFWPTRAVLFACIFLAISWRVVLFIRQQVLVRKKEKDNERMG